MAYNNNNNSKSASWSCSPAQDGRARPLSSKDMFKTRRAAHPRGHRLGPTVAGVPPPHTACQNDITA